MARAYFEAVVDELFVFGEYRAFDDPVASVDIVVEKGMSDMLHMYAYLVRTARLKPAFHQCHIAQAFEYGVVCRRFLAMLSIWVYVHLLAKPLMPAYMACDGATVFFEITPYQCDITAVHGMFEELIGKVHCCLVGFRHHQ